MNLHHILTGIGARRPVDNDPAPQQQLIYLEVKPDSFETFTALQQASLRSEVADSSD
jgi:hypothetical protein